MGSTHTPTARNYLLAASATPARLFEQMETANDVGNANRDNDRLATVVEIRMRYSSAISYAIVQDGEDPATATYVDWPANTLLVLPVTNGHKQVYVTTTTPGNVQCTVFGARHEYDPVA